MKMESLHAPLPKTQLELLSLFNNKSVSDEEWAYIKDMIANLFAKKSLAASQRARDENGWDGAKVEELLKTHLRTPYNGITAEN
jgi:hypothetical protein